MMEHLINLLEIHGNEIKNNIIMQIIILFYNFFINHLFIYFIYYLNNHKKMKNIQIIPIIILQAIIYVIFLIMYMFLNDLRNSFN